MQNDKMMLGPVLSLKFSESKGIELAWNFKGILHNEPEINHIFLLGNLSLDQAHSFLASYYSVMRMGDIIGVTRRTNSQKIKWLQKITTQLPENFVKKKHFEGQEISNSILGTLKKLQNPRNLTLLNVLLNPEADSTKHTTLIENIEKSLCQLRGTNSKCDRILVNFISKARHETRINGVCGVNSFFYHQDYPLVTCREIRAYWKSLVMESIVLKLEFKDIDFLGVSTSSEWVSKDLNILEKKYVGVPAIAFEEFILFMHSDQSNQIDVMLNFELTFNLFEQQQIKDKKEFKVEGDIRKVYQRTLNNEHVQSQGLAAIYNNKPVVTSFCKKEHYVMFSQKKTFLNTYSS